MRKWTSAEVLAAARRLACYDFDASAKLTAYAERIASDEAAVPVALAVFVPGDNTTGKMRIWSGKTDSVHMFLEVHGLPSHTPVTPLFTHPPAQPTSAAGGEPITARELAKRIGRGEKWEIAHPPIDLAAIREVIVDLRCCNCSGNDCNGMADKLSRALGDTP